MHAIIAIPRIAEKRPIYLPAVYVVPNCADAFAPLRDTINQNSGPQCSENASLKQEKILFSLPTLKGGLGVQDPVESAKFHVPYQLKEQ